MAKQTSLSMIGSSPWRTPYNHMSFPSNYEVNKKPSMTLPDQTLTIPQIMERMTHGLAPEGARVPIYDGEDFIPHPKSMDLIDMQEMLKQASSQVGELKKQLNAMAEKKKLKKVGAVDQHLLNDDKSSKDAKDSNPNPKA